MRTTGSTPLNGVRLALLPCLLVVAACSGDSPDGGVPLGLDAPQLDSAVQEVIADPWVGELIADVGSDHLRQDLLNPSDSRTFREMVDPESIDFDAMDPDDALVLAAVGTTLDAVDEDGAATGANR